ncbi:esterase/lipase family protein [Streptomyces sp. NPDC058646]|uniref:esterase/lipase family protein n=1 Tax=Streptomyces sp. NPDC058646 TaxID=3346574 RepID=UPI0036596FA5
MPGFLQRLAARVASEARRPARVQYAHQLAGNVGPEPYGEEPAEITQLAPPAARPEPRTLRPGGSVRPRIRRGGRRRPAPIVTPDPGVGQYLAFGYVTHLCTIVLRSGEIDTPAAFGAAYDEAARILHATGAAKVDVVTHSMGALPSRFYLKNLDGASKVDAWVSLAGPNHGTQTARWCGGAPCVEMRPGSDFLNHLNAGDETPGASRYATWGSPCDGIVNPASSVALDGALNTTTACLDHMALRTDRSVYEQVKAHLR